ncbi:hypothetical protein Fmac_004186 [Flemingia macrophylla]|uniref:Fe2OG dioxygenase domain-containing protein n=1 Tax=Flemingia macrophylla TaxID=520843 RepID=A0ABD1N4T3_9FABA
MESNTTSSLAFPTPSNGFDFSAMHKVPQQFVWPSKDLEETSSEELNPPVVDLKAIKDDEVAMADAIKLVREACMKHGFFIVTNHGVDHDLIIAVHDAYDSIFKLPLDKKLSAKYNHTKWGYSCAQAERYSTNLPWKEVFSFPYHYIHESDSQVVDFFRSTLGDGFEHTGSMNQRYCEAMKELSMSIFGLLAISLGVDGSYFQRFFEDAEAMMRCNRYPPCKNPSITLGVGPHYDPNSLTILHQDQVPGLELYVDDKWLVVPPRPETPDAFVVNIGDTLKAMTNGIYKSARHRVRVNEKVDRKSIAFFINPRADEKVIPPKNLLENEEQRNYPDFTWAQMFQFTQQVYRADSDTLPMFVSWLLTQQPPPSN